MTRVEQLIGKLVQAWIQVSDVLDTAGDEELELRKLRQTIVQAIVIATLLERIQE